MMNFFKSEKGSIMVETLFVLPLHLLMLFGVMWISTLSYDQLVFAQFNFTLRGSEVEAGDLQNKLWGDDHFVRTGGTLSVNAGSWWKSVSGGTLDHKFPPYLEGLRTVADTFFKAEKNMPDGMQSKAGLNTFYYKNNAYSTARADVTTAENTDWLKVAREGYPIDSVSYAPGTAKPSPAYTRNAAFTQWSAME